MPASRWLRGRHRPGQGSGGQRFDIPIPGQDFEVSTKISLEDAYHGTLLDLNLSVPEYAQNRRLRSVQWTFTWNCVVTVRTGAAPAQRLRP